MNSDEIASVRRFMSNISWLNASTSPESWRVVMFGFVYLRVELIPELLKVLDRPPNYPNITHSILFNQDV
ncbi:hypothetical protein PENTCL1PPCAC_7880, partial [Pristionchus entomophagus]